MTKTLFIILALLVFIFITCAMYCALAIASHFDEQIDDQIEKDIKKLLIKKRLCLKCKTGKEYYERDGYTKICPHINQQNGDKCDFFVYADISSTVDMPEKDSNNEHLPPENFNLTL